MPIIDKKRLIGNYGANLVVYILSNICLVRPVVEGTDIGVDLFCETIEDGQGFLHFWVQVKCGSQIKIKKNGKASCKFKVDHLRYWNRQPVPVFGFYIKKDSFSEKPKQIFVANISEYLITFGIPASKSKVIESQLKIDLENDKWQKAFLSKLKATTSLLNLREHGITSNIPELSQRYIKKYYQPVGIVGHAKKGLQTTRLTACSMVLNAALQKLYFSIEPDTNLIGQFVKILRTFEQGGRPEVMMALSLWASIMEGDTEKANQMVDIAIESINGDQKIEIAEKTAWQSEFDPVRKIINNL